MPSVDPRVAETSRIKNKILEVESQLKEGRKISARLRDQCEKKLSQIADVDQDIAAEKERFRWQKEELHFVMTSMEEESQLRIKRMKEEEKTLLQDIAEFDVIQYENECLHKKLKDLAEEQKISQRQQVEERERKKQKDFDLRMEMEEVFRKMIKSVDENYEREAVRPCS
jgi:DNA repair exonuclease SbcCD ATPase subunit